MNFKKEIEEIKINPNPELDEVIEKVFNETYNPNYYYNYNFTNSTTRNSIFILNSSGFFFNS
jgi:hypothetical protein